MYVCCHKTPTTELALPERRSSSPPLLGTTSCRVVSEVSAPRTISSFYFVVGLVLVCALSSAPITAILFASYDVLVALSVILHVKSGARRLQLWEVIAKVNMHVCELLIPLRQTHYHSQQNLAFIRRFKLAVVGEDVLELLQTELASARSERSISLQTMCCMCVCVPLCLRVKMYSVSLCVLTIA